MNKQQKFLLGIVIGLIFMVLLTSCQAEGIPASALLTPVHLRTQPTLTPEPSLTFTAAPPTFTASPIPISPTPSATPTDTLTPTISATPTISPTVTLTPRFSPTFTRTPTRTRTVTRTPYPTYTRAPTKTRTYTPTPMPPLADFRIKSPGLYSRAVSPIKLSANAIVGEDGYLNIALIGEDSRFIIRQALDFRRYIGQSITLSQEIPFEINGAGETARLELSSVDEYGRIAALTSVDLVLLKIGNPEIYPEIDPLEHFDIRAPLADSTARGGLLMVSGLARPANTNPVIIELITENGAIVGSAQFSVSPSSGGHTHSPFNVGVPYSVTATTPVRLTIRQESSTRIPGTVSVTSLLLTLEP